MNALFYLFLCGIAIQSFYQLYFFVRIFFIRHPVLPVAKEPISVIICARNEAYNLQHNLPAILTQRYSNDTGKYLFEVIVVDDASEDEGQTTAVLTTLQQEYPHLKIVTIGMDEQRTLPGKKFALGKGVAAAVNNWLVMTDADCEPASEHWLRQMTAPLKMGKQVAAGYGAYKMHNNWLNKFTRAETVHTFLQYSTYALAGQPYMAVGRNMACTREAMMKAQRYDAWGALPSGDDDLLVQAAGYGKNVGIVCHPQAFTYSEAKNNWKDYEWQKQRHLSTGKYYRTLVKGLLGMYAMSHALVWLLFFVLLVTGWSKWAIVLMAARCLLFWSIMIATAHKLQEKKLAAFVPIFDIGWLVYNFAFAPYILWKNKRQWK